MFTLFPSQELSHSAPPVLTRHSNFHGATSALLGILALEAFYTLVELFFLIAHSFFLSTFIEHLLCA